jgi:hypothetical protein
MMLTAAAIIFALSHGRILFLPFVLLLGVPLLALLKPSSRK